MVAPDRDVRPFQDVLIDLGARLGLPGLVDLDGTPKYPGLYADYIVNHQRKPGIGMLAGWRGADGDKHGSGEPNPNQLERYIANGCFWRHEIPESQAYFTHANKDYLDWAVAHGLHRQARARSCCSSTARCCRSSASPARAMARCSRPIATARASPTYFDPLPFWYRPFEEAGGRRREEFPLHAITQRPMAMYHSWGSQNAWLRQIHGAQPPVHQSRDRRAGWASPTTTGSGSRARMAASRRRSA